MIRASTNTDDNLLIVGASSRSAAFSALRAGLRPVCLDLFADVDLQRFAAVRRMPRDSAALIAALEQQPALPLIYVGGMENRPEVIAHARARRRLWGNDEAAIARARDPISLLDAARLARMAMPDWRSEQQAPPADGEWLIRPRGGSGGHGIEVWSPENSASATLEVPHLFQKRIHGVAYSATFLASAEAGDVRFVGITRQLIGEADCHADAFRWCGNIGPVALPVEIENYVRRLGNVLKWKLGLLGLYGIDFILDEENVPWVLEVNPRYPASLELLEHSTGQALLGDHCRCFAGADVPVSDWREAHPGEFLGKAILYSPAAALLERPLPGQDTVSPWQFPDIADIPPIGQSFRAGDPVCTVFAAGTSAEQVWRELQERLGRARETLTLCPN